LNPGKGCLRHPLHSPWATAGTESRRYACSRQAGKMPALRERGRVNGSGRDARPYEESDVQAAGEAAKMEKATYRG